MLEIEQITQMMRERVGHPATLKELLQLLRVPKEARVIFKRQLKQLVAAGELVEIRGERYGLPDLMNFKTSLHAYSRKRRIKVLEGLVQVNPPYSSSTSVEGNNRPTAVGKPITPTLPTAAGTSPWLGKRGLEAIPYHEPILVATFIGAALAGLAVFALVTRYRLWGTFWREWATSIDHKKIGIMYMVLGLVMLLRGFADALMMRGQQAIAFGDNLGYLPPHHYDQVFTAHGVIMIFFVAMPFITGLMNYVVPLQIGARDVAFPFLNNFSFWMTAAGAALVMVSLFVGEFSMAGWLAMAPLSGIDYSPGVGMDYYIWALQIAGVGTTLSGINLVVTIIKMRAPGMGLMKMPVFTWTSLCSNILIVASFPVLTAVLAMLTMDRYLGTNFFTNDLGGNAMLYVNLIWIWVHPQVYILILPLFGVYSDVVSTCSGKLLFG